MRQRFLPLTIGDQADLTLKRGQALLEANARGGISAKDLAISGVSFHCIACHWRSTRQRGPNKYAIIQSGDSPDYTWNGGRPTTKTASRTILKSADRQ